MNQNISMYSASIPVFKQLLFALSAILDKAQAHTKEQDISPDHLLQASLYPDMFNFIRQVQIAADFAKGISARLAGMEVPSYEDNESTVVELKARIDKTLQFISSIKPEQMQGSEQKEIILRPGTPKERVLDGHSYLLSYGLPQFFFHVTTAYDILRNQGVNIGKKDFMGMY